VLVLGGKPGPLGGAYNSR